MKANKEGQNITILTKTATAMWTEEAQLCWELLRSCLKLNTTKTEMPLDKKGFCYMIICITCIL